jgi:hypothetical protein
MTTGPSRTPSAERDKARPRRLHTIVTAVVCVCIIVAGLRLAQVHSETRDWRLMPAAAPTRLVFHEHAYLKAGPAGSSADPATPVGETDGGGRILVSGTNASDESSPTSLLVQDGSDIWNYAMLGGG